jgi:predicted  nucleic acid-binding Zn-ribbon protein
MDWFIFDDEIYDYVKLSLISQRESRPKPKKFHVKRILPIEDPLEEKLRRKLECRSLMREITILQERLAQLEDRLEAKDEDILELARQLAAAETELRLYRTGRLKPDES